MVLVIGIEKHTVYANNMHNWNNIFVNDFYSFLFFDSCIFKRHLQFRFHQIFS